MLEYYSILLGSSVPSCDGCQRGSDQDNCSSEVGRQYIPAVQYEFIRELNSQPASAVMETSWQAEYISDHGDQTVRCTISDRHFPC